MGTILAYKGEKILVDDDLLDELSQYKWHINSGYVKGYMNGKSVKLHRYILNPKKDELVDHINHNILDNRRQNLRICNHAQNMANRKVNKTSKSGFKGVTFDTSMSRRKRWSASIHHNDKRIKIGRYFTKEEAAEAYDRVAFKLKGNFAKLNLKERIVS